MSKNVVETGYLIKYKENGTIKYKHPKGAMLYKTQEWANKQLDDWYEDGEVVKAEVAINI